MWSPPPQHVPDAVERMGRRLKMEYVGMASGFFVIFTLLLFSPPAAPPPSGWTAGWLPESWITPSVLGRAILITTGLFQLFMALKKKTRDHLSASLLLLVTALVLADDVAAAGGALSLACLGFTLAALEGAIEKRKGRVFLLPLSFWIWGQAHPTVLIGLLVPCIYLLPAPGRDLRRKRVAAMALAGSVAVCIHPVGPGIYPAAWRSLLPSAESRPPAFVPAIGLALVALAISLLFWRRLLPAHRGGLLLAACASFIPASEGLFTLLIPVGLSATFFRNSILFDAVRPYFKRAEWYYFWAILLAALACLTRSAALLPVAVW